MCWSSTRARFSRRAARLARAGLVFQTNGSRTMCRIAQDTRRALRSLELDGEPCWYGVGGIEVATTPERMRELQRRQGFAPLLRPRGHRADHAGETARADPAARSRDDPRRVLRAVATGSRRRCGSRRRSRRRPRRGRRVRGRRHASPASTSATAACTACRRTGATSSANACCSAPGSGGRASARWPACRSRSSPCSTSSCGPIRSRSSPARRARSCTRSFATRTSRCTSASAATTTASAATTTSRSRRRSRRSARPARPMQPSLMPFTPEDFASR